jgi:hypothetical protein
LVLLLLLPRVKLGVWLVIVFVFALLKSKVALVLFVLFVDVFGLLLNGLLIVLALLKKLVVVFVFSIGLDND